MKFVTVAISLLAPALLASSQASQEEDPEFAEFTATLSAALPLLRSSDTFIYEYRRSLDVVNAFNRVVDKTITATNDDIEKGQVVDQFGTFYNFDLEIIQEWTHILQRDLKDKPRATDMITKLVNGIKNDCPGTLGRISEHPQFQILAMPFSHNQQPLTKDDINGICKKLGKLDSKFPSPQVIYDILSFMVNELIPVALQGKTKFDELAVSIGRSLPAKNTVFGIEIPRPPSDFNLLNVLNDIAPAQENKTVPAWYSFRRPWIYLIIGGSLVLVVGIGAAVWFFVL